MQLPLSVADVFWHRDMNGRMQFCAPLLGQYLCSEALFAVSGKRLYRWDGDSYQPDGEDWVHNRIIELLGDRWQSRYANSTIAWLRIDAPPLPEDPPPRPESVQAARRSRADDSVAGFVEEDCQLGADTSTAGWVPVATRKQLLEAYQSYCAANGHQAVGARKLYERLRSPGFGLIDTAHNGERAFKGISLTR